VRPASISAVRRPISMAHASSLSAPSDKLAIKRSARLCPLLGGELHRPRLPAGQLDSTAELSAYFDLHHDTGATEPPAAATTSEVSGPLPPTSKEEAVYRRVRSTAELGVIEPSPSNLTQRVDRWSTRPRRE
jgi:hypothetical protein